MIVRSTLLESKLNTSFDFGGLLVPANSVSDFLRTYTDPALFHSDGMGDYHLTKGGSLFRFRCKNRYFAVVCAHQINALSAGYDHNQLCIYDRKGSLFTSHGATFPKDDPHHSIDCIIYEFTEVVDAGNLASQIWMNVDLEEFREPLPKPLKVLCIGYPSYRNVIDYENMRYPISPNAVWGVESLASISNRLAFTPDSNISYDPDGMSGSPVFGFYLKNFEPRVYFGGILTNASRWKFHFIARSQIASLVEHALN